MNKKEKHKSVSYKLNLKINKFNICPLLLFNIFNIIMIITIYEYIYIYNKRNHILKIYQIKILIQ